MSSSFRDIGRIRRREDLVERARTVDKAAIIAEAREALARPRQPTEHPDWSPEEILLGRRRRIRPRR